MEHSINREQGLVFYLPINNELKLNLLKSSLWFSFYRPENLISGISLKSRIRIITQGRPLRTNEPYSDVIVYEGDPNLVVNQVFQFYFIILIIQKCYVIETNFTINLCVFHFLGKQTDQL